MNRIEGGTSVAITAFSVRRYPLDVSRSEVLVELWNPGEEVASIELSLLGDGEAIDVQRLRIEGEHPRGADPSADEPHTQAVPGLRAQDLLGVPATASFDASAARLVGRSLPELVRFEQQAIHVGPAPRSAQRGLLDSPP